VAKRKEKEDWQSSFPLLFATSSPSLSFSFSLPHFITQSSFSFLVATLERLGDEVAKSKGKEGWVMKCGKEKGKGRLGDEV
jgi:hypothetical protein